MSKCLEQSCLIILVVSNYLHTLTGGFHSSLCMPICRKTFSRNFGLVHHDGESSLSFCTTRRRYDGIIGAGPWI